MSLEKNLSLSEEHFCSFFDDQPEVLRRFLPDGTITFTNDAHCSFILRQKDLVSGQYLADIRHKAIRDLMEQSLIKLTAEHPEQVYDRLVVLQNNEQRWIRWTNRAILESGKITGYQSIGRDITELKNTQRELVIRNRELATLKIFLSELMGSRDIKQMTDIAFADEEGVNQQVIENGYRQGSPGDELVTKVKAAVRDWMRSPVSSASSIISIGCITIDFSAHRVNMDGQEVHLTATEYKVLAELASAVGQVLATDTILEKVWGNSYPGDAHLVWKVIRRLRQKIEPDPRQPRYIRNEHGRGYLLEG
ncbi:MAG: winged helix-turn-helix domain-containing protein [Anaerolineaceae bacterium]|nr:winged helix-turn-helix domain-containing protein [Anaerolineaceae bacterium]